jgi:hypothetical protein
VSSLGTIVLVILIIVAAIAAVVMSLAAVVLLIVILFGRQIERALTPDLWQGYDDGGG